MATYYVSYFEVILCLILFQYLFSISVTRHLKRIEDGNATLVYYNFTRRWGWLYFWSLGMDTWFLLLLEGVIWYSVFVKPFSFGCYLFFCTHLMHSLCFMFSITYKECFSFGCFYNICITFMYIQLRIWYMLLTSSGGISFRIDIYLPHHTKTIFNLFHFYIC